MRWLVGGLLAAVLVVGLVLAVTNLGSLFKTTPEPNASRRYVHQRRRRPPSAEPSAYRQPRTGRRTARH